MLWCEETTLSSIFLFLHFTTNPPFYNITTQFNGETLQAGQVLSSNLPSMWSVLSLIPSFRGLVYSNTLEHGVFPSVFMIITSSSCGAWSSVSWWIELCFDTACFRLTDSSFDSISKNLPIFSQIHPIRTLNCFWLEFQRCSKRDVLVLTRRKRPCFGRTSSKTLPNRWSVPSKTSLTQGFWRAAYNLGLDICFDFIIV